MASSRTVEVWIPRGVTKTFGNTTIKRNFFRGDLTVASPGGFNGKIDKYRVPRSHGFSMNFWRPLPDGTQEEHVVSVR